MKQASKFTQRMLGAAIAAAMFNLAGCGSADNPDKGSPQSYNVAGLVVDGYVAGGQVYWDTNEDGILNSWEPRAFTDKDGYFSRSKPDADGVSVDYCRADASAAEAKHCLRVGRLSDNAVLRIQGGIDLSSGEPFVGSMSLRTPIDSTPPAQVPVISPITSLLTYLPQERHAEVLARLGLQPGDEAQDYLNVSGGVNRDALRAALQLHKVNSLLQQQLGLHYGVFGEEPDLPVNPALFVYQGMAAATWEPGFIGWAGAGLIDGYVRDTARYAFDDYLPDLFIAANLTRLDRDDDPIVIPPFTLDLDSLVGKAADVTNLVEIVTGLIGSGDIGGGDPGKQARAAQKLVDLLLKKIEDGEAGIDNLLTLAGTDSPDRTALLDNLSDENSDISELVKDDFSDPAQVLTKSQAPALADLDLFTGPGAFEIAGTKMRLFGEEDKPAKGKRSSVDAAFFFEGEPGATQGDLTMCITYVENEYDPEAGSDDLTNARFKGTWQVLDGLNLSTVQMRVSIAQGDFSLLVKSIGVGTTGEGTDGPLYRFNFEGDLRKFDPVSVGNSGQTARVAIDQFTDGINGTTVPQSSADCAAQMN